MTGDSRGVLYPVSLPKFHRLPPPAPVKDLVRWFWIPEWDIAPGRTARQEIIAYPASNLVVEPNLVGLAGPTTRISFRDLTGRGWAVGALLRPAAVPFFTGDPASMRDTYVEVNLPDLHGAVASAMTAEGPGATAADGETRRSRAVGEFSNWLSARVPPPTEPALLANDLADLIDTDATVLRVSDAANRLGLSVRTVQRLAATYVGLPPAAMIRRRRLQEAADRLRQDPHIDLARLAAETGYADQAHLTRDFRSKLGFTPSRYRATSGSRT